LELQANEIIKKIESGEITWDNVYEYKVKKGEERIMQNYSTLKATIQQSLKVNINSEFGFLDNQYASVNNRNISGSITFMGRLLNQLTGNNIEKYMEENYGGGDFCAYQDTDSTNFDTKIRVKNLYKVTYEDGSIDYLTKEELTEQNYKITEPVNEIEIGELERILSYKYPTEVSKTGKEITKIPVKILTPSVNSNIELEYKPIIYIMKHKTEKELFQITIDDKEIVVTEDHSCIVLRDNKLKEVSPKEIQFDDKFIILEDEELIIKNKFSIKSLGVTTEDVYDIEVEDNHNFFGNNILVHNSGYIHFEPFVNKMLKEKFGKSYNELSMDDKKQAVEYMLEFINKEIQPIIDNTVDFIREKFNSFKVGFMGAKVEKIAQRGFWTAKKRYALLALFNEGSYYIEKPKISVTGIETIKSSTPDFAIEILDKALEKILKSTEEDFQDFLKSQKSVFKEKVYESPQAVCEVSKINNLTYDLDEKGYHRYNENGLRIGAPANSKAGIFYNKLLLEKSLTEYYQPIEEGMKSYIVKLKVPNPFDTDILAFLDDAFLFDIDAVKYIDADFLWEKHIISPLKAIVESIDYSLVKRISAVDDW
jgi:hypothetical protein